jgi:hypothetical protein
VAWLRWGVDWAVAFVVVLAVVLSGTLANASHAASAAAPVVPRVSAHEFPLVILVLGAVGWIRSVARRLPLVGRLAAARRGRQDSGRTGLDGLALLAPVDRCRAASIAALAGSWPADTAAGIVDAIERPDVATRARRIGLVARGRRGGDPFRVDHAPARTALALWRRLDADRLARFHTDAVKAWTGVPASEPGWVRLLDGTLAAVALRESAPDAVRRWAAQLEGPLSLRRGHRRAWIWTPVGLVASRADDWEHAAASALARWAGLITDDDDWPALRQRALGAAARGTAQRADERMIAAARIWTALVDDPAAEKILARPTVAHDPLAVALDALATRARDRDRDRVRTRSTEGAHA